jgi:hypothetical protein
MRYRGATARDAEQMAATLVDDFTGADAAATRIGRLELKPVSVICVLGRARRSSPETDNWRHHLIRT